MHRHGVRRRQAISVGIKQWCQVCRFRCSACGKSFTRLPASLIPFKRYIAAEIEGVLRHLFGGGKLSESPSGADESTLRRWWEEFRYKLPQWAGLLESWLFRMSRGPPGYIKLVAHPIKRLEEALARLPALPGQWPVMVKTLWWLKISHPLCLG